MALSAKRKKELEDRWKKSKAPSGFRKVPPGTYQAEVKDIKFNEDKCTIKWVLEIIKGSQKGVKLSRSNNLLYEPKGKGNSGMDFFKGDLEACGVALPSMNVISKTLKGLVGQILEVTVADQKTNPNFQNTYINKAVNATEEALDEVEEQDEVEEEEKEEVEEEKASKDSPVTDEDWDDDSEDDDEWEE